MKEKGLALLKEMLGQTAEFHNDQWESIESVLNRKKTLVVQRTGWGKSIVYFIATKLLREQGAGPTILISPLLSLMKNQIENATKIGISAETINSDNNKDWERVQQRLFEGKCDILLLSPERLGNQDFMTLILPKIKGGIGMFVIDEAHCISDWGHDFRPDYRRIVRIIKYLPPNVPVLATTATANQRVVEDIQEQLGSDLTVIRGPLMRESLRLQTIKLKDQAERLAWLYENITKIEGSGIIYCLTISDCNKVAKWLRKKGISVLEYHTRLSENKEENRDLQEKREQLLMQNKVKALASTIKLGMGYDKPDLAFVIHFQRPGSLVEYYQQIGRAGRKLDNAYAILLNGGEDDDIQEFFIREAFPTQEEMQKVVDLIENSENGLRESEMLKELNISQGRLRNCLKLLTIDTVISKENSIYSRTINPWNPDLIKSKRVTEQRYAELEKMKEFVDLKTCYMKFISQQLDDPYAKACGKCSNCEGKKFFSEKVSKDSVLEAVKFLQGEFLEIPPRKMWPAGIIASTGKKIPESEQNKIGKVLCTYGDAGWGKYVRQDKYENNTFREELVDASVDLIRNHWNMESAPKWVTAVPSLTHPELVRGLAQRIAKKLGIPYLDMIIKTKQTNKQKSMQNNFQQCKNAYEGFKVIGKCPEDPVLLIDDMVDSRWTFTVCGSLLKKAGSGDVYPFALASTSKSEGVE